MAKIKLTKNELKRQKDTLKRFQHFLPALQLKKQQLQIEIFKIHTLVDEIERETDSFKSRISKWIDVAAEKAGLESLISVEKISVKTGNIAGIDIPIFEKIDFKEEPYDFFIFPIWVDYGIEAAKEMMALRIKRDILQRQLELIKEELRIVNQRVNLFEKVKIPEAKENIRKISIWLGDLRTAEVVTGKIAKAKIERSLAFL